MPLLEGLPLVCHPDPTDAPGVARAIARHRVTLLCTTPALLQSYAHSAAVHPLMLRSLRLAVTGAEKLNEEARSAFKLKFGCEVYEGYGTTETTPVIAVNLPDALDTAWWQVQVGNKPGSVGLPLPGSSCKIVDPETLLERPSGEPGLILAGGSQVMLGYLDDPEGTAEVIVELDGLRWFRTGDWGYLDPDGFLTVIDRCSRLLARAEGVVSLAAVEAELRRVIGEPGLALVAVGLPDAEGAAERVVALIAAELQAGELQRRILAASLPPALMPNEIHLVTAVPTLGSGKVDHLAARQLAAELAG
jgi:acyl-[acyl-carrier-protein]-phospholipid O-acyltransferase/long-chain-fatty-acid--[acyl-carrier-protein] ligase